MRKITFYGKGDIGKPTLASSTATTIAGMDKRVMQIDCDPKTDSTLDSKAGQELTSIMDILRAYGGLYPSLDAVSVKRYRGIVCVEAGDPTSGSDCAGHGIIKTFDTPDGFNTFQVYAPEYVFFDVLGDVVCGGFPVPIRQGHINKVVIVTSGEKMALYAAVSIKKTLGNFQEHDYAKLRGIVLNCRSISGEVAIVEDFVQRIGTEVIGVIPKGSDIQRAEEQNTTVIQMDSELPVSQTIINIAKHIMIPVEEQKEGIV